MPPLSHWNPLMKPQTGGPRPLDVAADIMSVLRAPIAGTAASVLFYLALAKYLKAHLGSQGRDGGLNDG
jgi:hypothetical protein